MLMLCFIGITGCKKETNKSALDFKNEYESLNGVSKNNKEHRSLKISEDNPYEKVSQEEIIKKINDKDTFYLYVGDSLCPWCRSVLEKSIEVAKSYDIDKIYYIDIWDDEGNEILRDKYEVKDGELNKLNDGTECYNVLLKVSDKLLNDYTLTDENGNEVEVGEKRLFAPSYIYIENGEAKKLTTGISDKQTDSRQELNDEILEDEENQFKEFFNKKK